MKQSRLCMYGLIFSCILVLMAALGSFGADELTVYARRDTSAQPTVPGFWAVKLIFNNPVFPSNLAESVLVEENGHPIKFELRVPRDNVKATQAANHLILVPADISSSSASVKVTIEKGLSDSSGRRLLGKTFTFQFTTVENIGARISTFYRNKNEKGLILTLTQGVAENDLLKSIKMTPAVENLKLSRVYSTEFRLTGDFVYDKDYTLKISPAPMEGGSIQLAVQDFTFKGPGLKADVSSRTQRSVVELKGRQIFPLTLANVTKVRCSLTRVPPFLIPEISAAGADKSAARLSSLEDKAAALKKLVEARKINPVFAGESVKDSDVFFAPEAKDVAVGYSLPLSFRKNPEAGGAWIAAFTDLDSSARVEIAKLLQITDLSISYQLSANSLLVWVTSIYTGLPVPGVDLMLGQAHGQGFFVGKTDASGVLMIKNGKDFPALSLAKKQAAATNSRLDLSSVAWVVAATSSDACALELNTFRLKPHSISQAKSVKDKPDFRRGQVFTERGVYRPGETVHFKFLSRAYKDDRIVSPAGDKVKVEIIGPRDDIHYNKDLTLGDFGSCYDSLETKKYFPVGTYTVQVTDEKAKGDVQAPAEVQTEPRYYDDESEEGEGRPQKKRATPGVFTTTFMVQEFYKIHHYATVSIKPGKRESNQFIGLKRDEEFLSVQVKGLYYTGGPVKHGRARWKATLVPVLNPVKEFSGYMFGNQDEQTRFLESGESVLDSDGVLNFTVPLDSKLLTGIYGVEISGTVLDINGEPATEVQTYNPKQKYLVGISGHPKDVQMGYSAPLKVVVVDSSGKKISSGKVDACVMQQQYYYVLKRDAEGNINYNYERGWMKSFCSSLDLAGGEGVFEANLNESGNYMITFTFNEGGGRYTSQTLFKVGWRSYDDWDRRRGTKEVITSNELFLSLNKKQYKAAENVQLDFKTPRPVKKCLVSIERGDILEYQVIDAKDGHVSHQFPVKEGYQPNVYLSVIAAAGREGFPVYTSQADSDIPMVYYGYADIPVVSQLQKLNLEIDPGVTELKGRPAEKKSLSFKVTDQRGKGVSAEMAVCVVDEAILALTRFMTPELSSLAKFNLPLSVFAGDLRLDLVSQDLFKVLTTKPLTGGGMGFGEVSPSLRKDFRPVAYFNPALLTNEAGEASVEFKLPDTTTAYRVYAVVCDKASGFVSGQRKMVVTKEFFIEPSIPRFLCPGDKVTFPLVVHNKTKEKGDFRLSSEGTEDLKVHLKQTTGQIEPWSASVVRASAEVTGGAERGRFLFRGTFSGVKEKYSDAIEQTFPIMSRYLPVNKVLMGSFSGNKEISAELPSVLKTVKPEDLNPADFSAHLSLSTANWTKIAPGLKYLLHYPYGCIEQTSSGVIPLAGLRALIKTGIVPGISVDQVDKFLKGGVNRLLSMQTGSGGFAYWPGEQSPSWWGTMYATFALTLAQQAGLDVPEDRMTSAMEFMRKGLLGKEQDLAHGNQWTKELALFNLASNEQLSPQELDTFFKEYDSLSNQSKALLLLAAKRIGYLPADRLSALASKLDPHLEMKRRYYYDSTFREIAICLLATVEVTGGRAKQADAWAGELTRNFNSEGRWYSTADTGWCLFALSKYYGSLGQEKSNAIKVKIHYADEKPSEVEISGVTAYVPLDPQKLLKTRKVKIETDAKIPLNYTLNLSYPDMVTDPALLSKGFKLTKKMENLSGRDELRVGDVIRVVLEVELRDPSRTYSDTMFEYLALEDPVPAGMVPINSELKTEGAEQEKQTSTYDSYDRIWNFVPSYFEFRDDGVRVFKNSAYAKNYQYSYLARVVAEGDFWMRGSRISLMYDPQYFGRTLGKRITILPVGK